MRCFNASDSGTDIPIPKKTSITSGTMTPGNFPSGSLFGFRSFIFRFCLQFCTLASQGGLSGVFPSIFAAVYPVFFYVVWIGIYCSIWTDQNVCIWPAGRLDHSKLDHVLGRIVVSTYCGGMLALTPGDWRPVPVPRDSESAMPLKILIKSLSS